MSQSAAALASGQVFSLTDADFRAIAALTYDKSGIVLSSHKKDMVYSRLSRRLRELRMTSFAEYIAFVMGAGEADELGNLVNALTTNLTRFFREEHHFEHLRDEVLLPLLASNPPQKRLRIWSAGCSKGAEPYSIAMVLAACLEQHRGWDAKILATDIDTNMLAHGREGLYEAADLELIPKSYQRYTQLKDKTLQMKPQIKQLITFNSLNLLEQWPIKTTFDVIFCRNVVIYFDKDTQHTLFKRYRQLIKPQGRLYIGHSENLTQVSSDFKLEGKTIYRPC